MPANPVAENVLGYIGTILWTCQILPQIWKSYREESTEGLSAMLMFIWAFAGPFMAIYNVVENINIPLIIQPHVFGFLAALSWAQCLHYGPRKRSIWFSAASLTAFMIYFGALEILGVFTIRAAPQHRHNIALNFCGVICAVLISIGLIPQYFEIWRLKEVIGISMFFMAVDILGAAFSLLSLVFKPKFLPVAAVSYIAVIVLDGVVVICAIIMNPMARKRRAREAPSGDIGGSEAVDVRSSAGLSSSGVTAAEVDPEKSMNELKERKSQGEVQDP
ncbi:hypothetical protein FRB93_001534 [Tulasnella sp. JGI-2019a]|nr:hypothetical protein FRB93_001534 [Tulasnella sp. JGI-2019a]